MGSVESRVEAQHDLRKNTDLCRTNYSSQKRRDAECSDAKIKRESPQEEQQGHLDQDSSSAISDGPKLPPLSRSENPNVERLREAVYVRYLFEDFVLSPSRATPSGWLALLLPSLYATAANDTTLNLAVRSAAYAYMGNRRQVPELQIEARETYGHSLKVLAADLTSLDVATSNDTAAAVLVLGLYECIAGSGSKSFWHSHGHGLSLLMQLRTSQSTQDQQSLSKEENPDGMIICQMQRRNLDLRKPPSAEEGTYIRNLDGSNPANRMFGCAFQCSHVVARAYEEVLKADGSRASNMRLEKAIAEIHTFDTSLIRLFRTCVTSSSPTDKYRTDAELQAQWLASCPTYRAMAMWCFLKASRIALHETNIECLGKLQGTGSAISEALISVKQSTEAIFSAVKFMIDDSPRSLHSSGCRGPRNSGGYYMLWPLHVIVDCRFTDQSQKEVARDVLLRIGSEMGLKHALEIARVVE